MGSKTKINSYTLEWLTDPAPDLSTDAISVQRLIYPLAPELGSAWVESLVLHDGIILCRGVHEMEPAPSGQLVHLMNAGLDPTEPIFGAQIWLSGQGCHREYWNGREQQPINIVAVPGRDTFRHLSKWSCDIMVEGGVTSEMRAVTLPDLMLKSLLGEGAAQDLLDRLGLLGSVPTVVRAMPLHVSAPLREALSGHVSGPARKLFAQARVLDYLVALLEHVSSDPSVRKERRHRARIRDLHDHLIHLEGRLPTLVELATEFGLSARRLNEEFAAEYGMSVYNFITNHRLNQAHASIQSGAMPLKALAARLGYSHVNHFTVAFRRKFGYPPGSLRKGMRSE